MKTVDYSKEKMDRDIARLFREIYPGWSEEYIQRALYDEKSPLHVATRVAIVDNRFVGQANVFLLQHNSSIANIGFHVHPHYQRQGIGQRLAIEVMASAKEAGVTVQYSCYKGMIHAFFSMAGVLNRTMDALDEAATALRSAFAK